MQLSCRSIEPLPHLKRIWHVAGQHLLVRRPRRRVDAGRPRRAQQPL